MAYDNEEDTPNPMDRAALLAQLAQRGGGVAGSAGEVAAARGPAAPGVPGVTPAAPAPLPYSAPVGDLSAGAKENRASTTGALGGAASGASMGAYFGPVGMGIGAGVGALAGLAKGRTNNTADAREQFARSQGLPDSTALWDKLNSSADPAAAQELQNRALNRIGKHDDTANAQWMQDVQAALQAGKTAPPPPVAPPGAPAAPGTPAGTPPLGTPPSATSSASGAPRAQTTYGPMAGFDTGRLNDANDKSGKYTYGRFASDWLASGKKWGADGVRAFLAANPDWGGKGMEGNDPRIRQKQDTIGKPSMWQDTIRDSGPGGANGVQFENEDGGAPGGAGQPGHGMASINGGALGPSTVSTSPDFFKQLMARLQGSLNGPATIDDNALRQLL